jgi:hypothetical protein
MVWDDGLTLHTNLLLSGVWHLYRTGERWRKPSSQLRAARNSPDKAYQAAVVEPRDKPRYDPDVVPIC